MNMFYFDTHICANMSCELKDISMLLYVCFNGDSNIRIYCWSNLVMHFS